MSKCQKFHHLQSILKEPDATIQCTESNSLDSHFVNCETVVLKENNDNDVPKKA
jgi:hypothetical protein